MGLEFDTPAIDDRALSLDVTMPDLGIELILANHQVVQNVYALEPQRGQSYVHTLCKCLPRGQKSARGFRCSVFGCS